MLVIENNKKVLEDDEREKSRLFKDELLKFNTLRGKENFKVPQIGGKELDLYKLFKEVITRGGSQQVSENKQWKEIVNALELPASCTSASFTLRNHYSKCLHEYEIYYLKAQQNPGMNMNTLLGIGPGALNIPSSSNVNLNGTGAANTSQTQNTNNSSISIFQPNPQQEQKFLNKKVIRTESEYNLIFRFQNKQVPSSREKTLQKKVRLLNAIPDLRRVVLAFESHVTCEIVWAINMLTLFSANNNCNIIIENQPYLLESLTHYMYYCVNNISEIYHIIEILDGKFDKSKEKLLNKMGNTINYNSANFSHPVSSNKILNKRAKSFAEATTFNFLDEVNNTISLSTISKKNKSLEEIQKIYSENDINTVYNEVTEYELTEHLISIVQIIRNLSFIRQNEPSILKCQKFMNLIYLLLIHSNIQEIRNNCLDIITNLSKHIILKEIKFPLQLMLTIYECLKNNNRDISEQGLECLRRLTFPTGNEEFFEKMPDEFYEELINLLISYKVEIRESALEILYCISDQKFPTKTRLGKQNKCIQRLVALTCSNSYDNRIPKFAACTLAKLAEVPNILKMVMPFEQELFVAACTDDSITKIILGIISN
jgi:hypothetical protein